MSDQEMRPPTFEEMVAGIERAVSKQLNLMRHGTFECRPENAWPEAFQRAVGNFLEKHQKEIIQAIANRSGE